MQEDQRGSGAELPEEDRGIEDFDGGHLNCSLDDMMDRCLTTVPGRQEPV
jgi:hypothetical protein